MQTQCYWPSGKEIRRLSVQGCLDLLAGFGMENVDGMMKSELRGWWRNSTGKATRAATANVRPRPTFAGAVELDRVLEIGLSRC